MDGFKSWLKQLIEQRTIVVFDLETSGLDKNRDYIIEVGAVKITNGKICDRFSTLVNSPQMEALSAEVEQLTGITFEQLKCAPLIEDALKSFYEFAKGSILVAHNLLFDLAFLCNWGDRCGISFDEFEKDAMDTISLAEVILGDKIKSFKLSSIAQYFDIEFTHHRALDDAETTAKILLELAVLQNGNLKRKH